MIDTTKPLNEIMEFDHVIIVHEDGSITDAPNERAFWAPELVDGTVSPGWTLMGGYSGQYGYAGPIMHPSEYIGGVMERDIRSTPGVYVALVSTVLDVPEGEDDIDGWAVARKVEGCPECGALRWHKPMANGTFCPLA